MEVGDLISLLQLLLTILIFTILFYGIGFIINMLLKTTWILPIIYPIIIIIMIDKMSTLEYFTNPDSLKSLRKQSSHLNFFLLK